MYFVPEPKRYQHFDIIYAFKTIFKSLPESTDSSIQITLVFSKMCVLERGSSPAVFVSFKIIISHIFPENIIKIPPITQYVSLSW